MKDVTRREFLQWTGAAAAAAAIGSQAAPQAGGAPMGGGPRRPNVLLILTDDQGWGDIHSHGNDKLDTPAMDALAAGGAEFDRFYVCPLCAPTRSSLLTGRYHWRCGVDGVTRGKEIMRANRDKPFFAYVPYNAPHTPYQVPDRYFDKYAARGFGPADARIYGMIENLDDNLARLLKTLDELKLAEDTVVIFLGDNGPNGNRYNGGMAGAKGSNSEGGCRVPCFVRWPGHIKPGTVIKQIAAHMDILPTVAAIAGIVNPKTLPLDGKDLSGLLLGKGGDWPDRMLFEKGAVRTQRWRLQTGAGGPGA
jgi:arylsulfatase A-like enzyme